MANEGKPLLTLKSDLRNLKYSDFGEKPYVQHDIPSYEGSGRRTNQINARTNDLERFTKLLTSKPGLKFQGNQALLQQVGVVEKVKEAKKGGKTLGAAIKGEIVSTIKNNAMATTAIFAQVPLNGTGTHFINNGGSTYLKSGGDPTEGSAFGDFLRNSLGAGVGAIDGASSALAGDPVGSPFAGGGLQANIEDDKKSQLDVKEGDTYLNKVVTRDKGKWPGEKNVSVDSFNQANKSLHYKQGDEEKENRYEKTYDINDQSGKKKNYLTSPVYIQSRLKLGDQGNKNAEGVDEVNKLEVSTRGLLGEEATDIIPFEFNIREAQNSKYVYFRAHLDSFDDNYTGDWSGNKYIGRAEEFYTYQGFKREISFAFKIAAFSKDELVPLYKKLNTLVGATAPTYGQSAQFMRGTLCRVTVGDYIYRQSGFISNIGLSWSTNYPWEIDLYNENYPRVPHLLDVSVSFTPIHNFNVASDVAIGSQNYIGGEKDFVVRPKQLETASEIETQEVQQFETQQPRAEVPTIPRFPG